MRSFVSLALVAPLGACVSMNPAAPQPERIAPVFEERPVPAEAGRGRVILDVVDGPTRVDVVLMSSSSFAMGTGGYAAGWSNSEQLLCARTPCAANVPYGDYQLSFTGAAPEGERRDWTSTVHVGEEPKHVRVKLSETEMQSTNSALFSIGLMTIGGTTGLVGGMLAGGEVDGGAELGLVGVTAFVGGLVWYLVSETEITPGAETQWTGSAGGTADYDRDD